MRADGSLRQIPVGILTTSTSERDATRLYTPGRCRYIVKTSDFSALSSIAAEIHALALDFRDPVWQIWLWHSPSHRDTQVINFR